VASRGGNAPSRPRSIVTDALIAATWALPAAIAA
jgi:hypothetical protein